MAFWITPKTDWTGYINEYGKYDGDYFTDNDYNRIRNNLIYLADIVSQLFVPITLENMESKTSLYYVYASDINRFENNLNLINNSSYHLDIGDTPVFHDNEPTIDFIELNRIESVMLTIYHYSNNEERCTRKFTWNFGMDGDDFL